jgi:hypothetical protein
MLLMRWPGLHRVSHHAVLVLPPHNCDAGGFIVNEVFNDGEYLKHGVTLKQGTYGPCK